MQPTILSGVAMWSVWQPDRNLFFNSFFFEGAFGDGAASDGGPNGGNLIVDPLPLSDADAAEIARRGGAAWVAITNRDHERDSRAVAARFGAKIAASELDAPLLSGPVDRLLHDGDTIGGATVIALEGVKTPGEFALNFRALRAVLVGDALWGTPAGALRLMPDEKLADPPRAALSLRKIAAALPEHLLLGDGASIFGGARSVLWKTLEARTDAYVNKINRDEGVWHDFPGSPHPYDGDAVFEIGDYIGAEKLGYRLMRLEPGKASCPLHWHAAEEELFVVMSGSSKLVGPRGEVPLRAGDYLAFPTRPSGAHKIVNDSSDTCEILMIANIDPHDVCSYPDSRKVLIELTGVMLRDNPTLEYFDGE
jgi:uncharacterized cupin superfamily protein